MYNNSTLPPRLRSEACLAARARRVHRALVRLYDDRLRELGITVAQLDILATSLHLGSPLRPIDLSRAMVMERSTVSRNLARLAKRRLIRIAAGKNGREQRIEVTARGRLLSQRI
jgi:DNA-binding MarR family transcriptional regulator